MAIGKVGAYATTDKTENYVGQALTNLGDVAFRDRQFKQENEDKVKAEKVAQAKASQDEANAVKMPDLKTVTSLNSNLEILKTRTASDIAGKVVAIKNEINNTQDRGKIADLQGKLSQANLAFDSLNDFSTKVNDSVKYLVDNKEKIDPDSYEEQMAKYTMAAKGYGQIRLDDNMHPVFDSTDENGNVLKEKGSENKSLSDFFVNNAQNLMFKSTFNDDVDKVMDKIGKVESKNENGQTITTRISPTKEAIATAKETLFNELLNKKNNVYRVSKDNGIKQDDVESLRKIVNKTIDSKLDVTAKNEINTAEQSRIDRLNKDARDESKELDKAFFTGATTVTRGGYIGGIEIKAGSRSVSAKGLFSQNADGSKRYASNVIVNPDGGFKLKIPVGESQDFISKEARSKYESWQKKNPNAKIETYPRLNSDTKYKTEYTTLDSRTEGGEILQFIGNVKDKKGVNYSSVNDFENDIKKVLNKTQPAKIKDGNTPIEKEKPSQIDEGKVKFLMKQNPKATRQQIIDALKNQK